MRLKDTIIIGICFLLALLCIAQVAKGQDVPAQIPDALRAEAWHANARVLMALEALKQTKEYKQFEAEQARVSAINAKLQKACGPDLIVRWDADQIACVERPKEEAK